jgi:hypothetical protein
MSFGDDCVRWRRLVCVLAAPVGIGISAAQAAPSAPIVVIVLENKTYNDIVGSKNAPYLQSDKATTRRRGTTTSRRSPWACAKMVPYTAFDPAHLRSFSYVVPNNADNMHDGSSKAAQIKAGDAWLADNVPAMVAHGARVIVTWDEGTRSNEHIATIAVGGGARAGARDPGSYTHYGLLAGLEDAFGVRRLHAAKTATPFPVT